MEFIPVIFVIFMALLFLYMMFIHIPWSVHVSMVKSDGIPYGKASYEKFLEEFGKVEWESGSNYSITLRSRNREDSIHASIIKFNGKGMIISNVFSYLRVTRHIKKYNEQHFSADRNVTKWR